MSKHHKLQIKRKLDRSLEDAKLQNILKYCFPMSKEAKKFIWIHFTSKQ